MALVRFSRLHQPRFVRHRPSVEGFPEVSNDGFVDVPAVRVDLQFCYIPVFDLGIRRVIRPRDINTFDMMKQLPGLIPLIRSKLPRLPGRHHTNYPIPRVGSEFTESLNGVDDEVPRLGLRFSAGGVDVCAFTVDRD